MSIKKVYEGYISSGATIAKLVSWISDSKRGSKYLSLNDSIWPRIWKAGGRNSWGDGHPPKKVRVTVEEI